MVRTLCRPRVIFYTTYFFIMTPTLLLEEPPPLHSPLLIVRLGSLHNTHCDQPEDILMEHRSSFEVSEKGIRLTHNKYPYLSSRRLGGLDHIPRTPRYKMGLRLETPVKEFYISLPFKLFLLIVPPRDPDFYLSLGRALYQTRNSVRRVQKDWSHLITRGDLDR